MESQAEGPPATSGQLEHRNNATGRRQPAEHSEDPRVLPDTNGGGTHTRGPCRAGRPPVLVAPAQLTWAGQGWLGEAVRQRPDAGLPQAPQEMLQAPRGGVGQGEGIPEHPWASHRVLCAGRGAHRRPQRTLDTHSTPGRAQRARRAAHGPLLTLSFCPAALAQRSGLRAAYVNTTLITRAAAADTYCRAGPYLGSDGSEGMATPPSRNTRGR